MPIASGQCPNCGATVEFRNGASMSLVCRFCRQVVVRSDRGLERLGEAADLAATESSLAVGDRGTLLGKTFEVVGRLVLDHPAGGTWEEYYIALDGDAWGWLANEQGRWEASTPVEWDGAAGLKWDALAPGANASLGPYGQFVVAERNDSRFATAQGELPFAARPGTPRHFVDLSGASGAWASLDFGEQTTDTPKIYVGRVISPADLVIERLAGGAEKPTVATTELKCPQCGGDLPARAPGKTERIACPYCRTISDLATHTIIARQEQSRSQIAIPLGSKATFVGIEWVVIGYAERSATIQGDWFSWSEYLLYSPNDGFRWLIYDEGSFYFGTPIAAGDVDASEMQMGIVRYRGHRYDVRNRNSARVDYVLGEFYWKVEIGEQVEAADFECGTSLVSREEAAGEISWTFSTKAPSSAMVFRSFGIASPVLPPSVGGSGGSYSYGGESGESGGSGCGMVIVIAIVVVFLGIAGAMGDDCNGGSGDGYSGGHSSHSYGGFGGK